MIMIMVIIGVISAIGWKLAEFKERIQEIFIYICGIAFTLAIILGTVDGLFGKMFQVIVSSEDTVYEIASFSQAVTLTETRYIIKIADNTNTVYILSDSESHIEIDYGDKPTKITIIQNMVFDYCTFNTTEEKVYKIY